MPIGFFQYLRNCLRLTTVEGMFSFSPALKLKTHYGVLCFTHVLSSIDVASTCTTLSSSLIFRST